MKRVMNESVVGLIALACAVMVFVATTLDLADAPAQSTGSASLTGPR